MTEKEKERAWQFLTMLSRSKEKTVSLFAYETRKLKELLPTLEPCDVITNTEGDVTANLFNREDVIKGLKLKYKFTSKSLTE